MATGGSAPGAAPAPEPVPGRLERWQVLIYAAAIGAGAAVGALWPGAGGALGRLLWPLLAVLLFATFLQIPVAGMRAALGNRRFLGALFAGNFVAVPLVVWGLSWLVPDHPSVRLGFFLVLLAPCTDWFNTFTYLGRGDGRLSVAATPLLLLAQMLCLPVLLALFLGPEVTNAMRAEPFVRAFAGIVAAPLALAIVVQRIARGRAAVARGVARAGWLPVPLLAAVVLIISASEIHAIADSAPELLRTAPLYIAYLAIVPFIAIACSRLARLDGAATRTVVFSLGTRNSFVILPLVLAWPGAGAIAVATVVLQSVVELGGMLAYLALVPRLVRR